MERKNINYVGLDLLPVYFNDVSQRSPDVFKITNKPLKFTSGKNLIKFQGNPTALKPGSVLHIEVLDYNRNPIYSEVLNYIDEDKSRVIAIYIYNDTPPGDAKITLCTELASLGGKPVPEFWRNRLNAKWTATIPINPTDPNETEIIFETEPNVKVQEQVAVQLARQYTTTQFPIYSTGLVKYISRNGLPAIELINGTSSADMVGGTITVAAPSNPLPTPAYPVVTTPYSSTIKKVINESLLLLDDEYIVYSSNSLSPQIYNKFDPSSYTISYEATPTYIPTQHSESNAIVEIEELEPGTGDISRIKFYTNNKGTVGTWILSNDIELQPTEIFIANSGSLYPDTSIGKFTSQSIIDTYWTGSTYLGFVESTGPTLTWSTASMINAMSIDSSTDITAYNNVHIVEVSSSFPGTFIGDSSYRVTLDAIGTRSSVSNNADPVLSIYASGSAFKFDSTDVLNQELPIKVGKRIGQLIVTSTSPMFDDVSFQFKSEYTGTGVLLFVVESGAWKIADIRTETDADVGYTPNYTRFRSEIPTTHKSDNQLSFKVEYYNQSGVRSNLISYINDINWEGGNRYIDGAFSMLTGSLYVADTLESGIDISGLKDTGFIRSLPYGGFNQATGSGAPGFLLFSGSALPNQSETTYEGVGLEMVADANNYFRFRTNPSILDIRTNTIFISGSSVEINTPNFFLGQYGSQYISGSGGNIEISSSNFQLTTDGNINATGGTIGGVYITNTALSSSTTLAAPDGGPAYKLSGSGEISGSELYIRQVFNLTGAGNAVFPLIDTRLGLIDGRNIGRQIVSNYDEIIRANVDDTSEVTVNEHIFQLLPYENSLVVSYQLQARATTGDRVNGTAYFKLYRQTTSGSASDAEWDSWTYVQTMLNYGLTTTALGGPASASHHYINDNITPYSIPVAAEAQFVKVEVCLKNNVIAGSADPDNNTRLKGYSIIATRTLAAETQGSTQAPDVVAPI